MQNQKRLDLTQKYILCLCEGTAELELMNLLLEENKLCFTKEDLIGRKLHSRQSVKKIEEDYLSFSFERPLMILRIIDSRNEQFNLSKAYRGRFEIVTICTRPEIEILLIIVNGDYEDYAKFKQSEKPSEY